jgi:hypothetical protein
MSAFRNLDKATAIDAFVSPDVATSASINFGDNAIEASKDSKGRQNHMVPPSF